MKRKTKGIAVRTALWVLVAGMSLAVLQGPAVVTAEEDVVGGRVSRMCRAGLWLVGNGHLIAGGGLIWLGC